jgi:hypothetical protein
MSTTQNSVNLRHIWASEGISRIDMTRYPQNSIGGNLRILIFCREISDFHDFP